MAEVAEAAQDVLRLTCDGRCLGGDWGSVGDNGRGVGNGRNGRSGGISDSWSGDSGWSQTGTHGY